MSINFFQMIFPISKQKWLFESFNPQRISQFVCLWFNLKFGMNFGQDYLFYFTAGKSPFFYCRLSFFYKTRSDTINLWKRILTFFLIVYQLCQWILFWKVCSRRIFELDLYLFLSQLLNLQFVTWFFFDCVVKQSICIKIAWWQYCKITCLRLSCKLRNLFYLFCFEQWSSHWIFLLY